MQEIWWASVTCVSVYAGEASSEGAITRVTVSDSAATLAMVSAGGQLSINR